TLSRLDHPNIATIYDFDSQQGLDFLVMEYIPGITLSQALSGPFQAASAFCSMKARPDNSAWLKAGKHDAILYVVPCAITLPHGLIQSLHQVGSRYGNRTSSDSLLLSRLPACEPCLFEVAAFREMRKSNRAVQRRRAAC